MSSVNAGYGLAWRSPRTRRWLRRAYREAARPRLALKSVGPLAAGLAVVVHRQAAALAESALRAESAVALADARSQTLNQVAHDLRAPLALLLGYLSMLEDGVLGEVPPDARAAVRQMRLQGGVMLQMTDQLLEMARIEDARLMLNWSSVDLSRLVGELARAFPLPGQPPYRLVLELPDAPLVLQVDQERISSTIRNLLDNAVRYSPEGGIITCRVRRAGGFAEVSVTDTGMGIPHEHHHRIFKPFGRVVTEETRAIPGTGLGLHLGREIARRHHGDLTFHSEPGRGSTFTLRLALPGECA